jgi:hypothetical protein
MNFVPPSNKSLDLEMNIVSPKCPNDPDLKTA